MDIVFISNYFSHHQAPFCDEVYKKCNGKFFFIETEQMTEERLNMGWGIKCPDYVLSISKSDKTIEQIESIIYKADVVIKGDGPYSLISRRLNDGKLTFIYSERIYKNFRQAIKWPYHFVKFSLKYRKYNNLHLLCASAFAAIDYRSLLCFKERAYKWGYFPITYAYDDLKQLVGLNEEKLKHKKDVSILWVARLIGLKHPETLIYVAKKLKDAGINFHVDIIGNGPMEDMLKRMISNYKLKKHITLLGSMSPLEVRKHMCESDILLFTSDRNEGWGAVINEAMNSKCAVVASSHIGSVPFLIDDGVNGLVYKNGDLDDLYRKVRFLIENPEIRKEISERAYTTITQLWSYENAVKNFLALANGLLKKKPVIIENGPCSPASMLRTDWYKKTSRISILAERQGDKQ